MPAPRRDERMINIFAPLVIAAVDVRPSSPRPGVRELDENRNQSVTSQANVFQLTALPRGGFVKLNEFDGLRVVAYHAAAG